MMKINKQTAEFLLQSKAIKLEPANPFIWASGWNSPIYCDNRKTLSFPIIRRYIRDAYTEIITKQFPDVEVIAGVATGAIAQGALVADKMNLPFIYVRSSAKGHGMQNLIEGKYEVGNKMVVIEDLISTGGSSLKAVEALREANCKVLGMVAIFTYGFDAAIENFKNNKLEVHTLTDYENMLTQAVDSNYINESQLPLLREWRKDPANWKGM